MGRLQSVDPNSYAAVLVGTWKTSDPVSLKSVNSATCKWQELSFSSSLRKVCEGSILDGFWGQYRAGSQKPRPVNGGFGFRYLRYGHDDLLCLVKIDALEKLSQQCRLQPISSAATTTLRYNGKYYQSESERFRRQASPQHQRGHFPHTRHQLRSLPGSTTEFSREGRPPSACGPGQPSGCYLCGQPLHGENPLRSSAQT